MNNWQPCHVNNKNKKDKVSSQISCLAKLYKLFCVFRQVKLEKVGQNIFIIYGQRSSAKPKRNKENTM